MSKIQTIIKEAIGEDKELWKPIPFPESKEGVLDSETVKIAMQNASEMRDNRYELGFNQALADLRAKVPEIEKAIVEEIQLQLMKGWDKIEIEQGDTTMAEWRNFKFIRNTTREIIKNLTS